METSFGTNVITPLRLMVAVLIGLVCIILIIVSLSQTGMGGTSTSTALVSANTNLTNSIPYVAVLLATGLVYWAMDTGRRR